MSRLDIFGLAIRARVMKGKRGRLERRINIARTCCFLSFSFPNIFLRNLPPEPWVFHVYFPPTYGRRNLCKRLQRAGFGIPGRSQRERVPDGVNVGWTRFIRGPWKLRPCQLTPLFSLPPPCLRKTQERPHRVKKYPSPVARCCW